MYFLQDIPWNNSAVANRKEWHLPHPPDLSTKTWAFSLGKQRRWTTVFGRTFFKRLQSWDMFQCGYQISLVKHPLLDSLEYLLSAVVQAAKRGGVSASFEMPGFLVIFKPPRWQPIPSQQIQVGTPILKICAVRPCHETNFHITNDSDLRREVKLWPSLPDLRKDHPFNGWTCPSLEVCRLESPVSSKRASGAGLESSVGLTKLMKANRKASFWVATMVGWKLRY